MKDSIAKKELLKIQILNFIKTKGPIVSFAELSWLDNFNGESSFRLHEFTNIILWKGMSEEAIMAMDELLVERVLGFVMATPSIYQMKDKSLDLPIYNPPPEPGQNPKTPHWLPLAITFFDRLKGRKAILC